MKKKSKEKMKKKNKKNYSKKEGKQSFDGKRAFIAPDVIIGMITESNKEFSKILDRVPIHLITSDFALYEAISSIQKEELVLSALSKFLFRVQIVSSPKITISMDRIDHLRDVAKLKKFGGNR